MKGPLDFGEGTKIMTQFMFENEAERGTCWS